jgi:hypothetical protein
VEFWHHLNTDDTPEPSYCRTSSSSSSRELLHLFHVLSINHHLHFLKQHTEHSVKNEGASGEETFIPVMRDVNYLRGWS